MREMGGMTEKARGESVLGFTNRKSSDVHITSQGSSLIDFHWYILTIASDLLGPSILWARDGGC